MSREMKTGEKFLDDSGLLVLNGFGAELQMMMRLLSSGLLEHGMGFDQSTHQGYSPVKGPIESRSHMHIVYSNPQPAIPRTGLYRGQTLNGAPFTVVRDVGRIGLGRKDNKRGASVERPLPRHHLILPKLSAQSRHLKLGTYLG